MATAIRKGNIRTIALPTEHGGWGFILVPIILGLLVAPSVAGFALATAALGVFLLHQPLKIWLKDVTKRRHVPRTRTALQFVLIYGALALIPFLLLLITKPLDFVLPLLVAIPFALVQVRYDIQSKSRDFVPEVAGAIALGGVASSIAILGGWQPDESLALWLVLIGWAVTSIVYIRARLRLERGVQSPLWVVHTLHVMTVGIALWFGLGWLVVAFGILMLRAVHGLSPYRWRVRTAIIGITEMVLGLLIAICGALAFV